MQAKSFLPCMQTRDYFGREGFLSLRALCVLCGQSSGRFFRFEGGADLGDDLGKGRLVLDGDVGEDLAVEADVRGLEALDETAVGEPGGTHGGVETGDPQSAEIALAGLPVAVGPVFPLHLGIFRVAEEFGTAATVSLGRIDDALTTGAAGWSIGCSWHVI